MKSMAIVTVLLAGALGQQQLSRKSQPMHVAAAVTYEHLATAILEIRATEDNLVRGILMHHHAQASHHLEAASRGMDAKQHLEAAAAEVADIANEGDKRVQAVRQRLLKGGHHHHTDAETKEDYIFVDNKEKMALLALSSRIGKMAGRPSPDEIRAASDELDKLFAGTIAAE